MVLYSYHWPSIFGGIIDMKPKQRKLLGSQCLSDLWTQLNKLSLSSAGFVCLGMSKMLQGFVWLLYILTYRWRHVNWKVLCYNLCLCCLQLSLEVFNINSFWKNIVNLSEKEEKLKSDTPDKTEGIWLTVPNETLWVSLLWAKYFLTRRKYFLTLVFKTLMRVFLFYPTSQQCIITYCKM